MSNTFEAFVDIKEYGERIDNSPSIFTKRYEIDACSRLEADRAALYRAESEHPRATEFDVRLSRLLQ
ncbi:MAG: hypothetical protein ICV62_06185 [Cyanobacteria bacterium Co-bin13]|nr:hypothetical protein [Cyanobacteria bacterium Co-bin13]